MFVLWAISAGFEKKAMLSEALTPGPISSQTSTKPNETMPCASRRRGICCTVRVSCLQNKILICHSVFQERCSLNSFQDEYLPIMAVHRWNSRPLLPPAPNTTFPPFSPQPHSHQGVFSLTEIMTLSMPSRWHRGTLPTCLEHKRLLDVCDPEKEGSTRPVEELWFFLPVSRQCLVSSD